LFKATDDEMDAGLFGCHSTSLNLHAFLSLLHKNVF